MLKVINNQQAIQLLVILKVKQFKNLFIYENQIQCGNTINLVDNEADPNIIILFDYQLDQFNIYSLNSQVLKYYLDSIDWDSGFLTPYKYDSNINWSNIYSKVSNKNNIDKYFKQLNEITIAGLYHEFEDVAIESLKRYFKNLVPYHETFNVLLLPIENVQDTINLLKKNLDDNESLLTIDDAKIVDDNWKYKSNGSIDLFRISCSSKISGAYRVINGNGELELVSWILHYSDGSVGNLFTNQSYRGYGYAKKVSSYLLIQMLKSGYRLPYCYINVDNKASHSVMGSLGFKSCGIVKWIIASK